MYHSCDAIVVWLRLKHGRCSQSVQHPTGLVHTDGMRHALEKVDGHNVDHGRCARRTDLWSIFHNISFGTTSKQSRRSERVKNICEDVFQPANECLSDPGLGWEATLLSAPACFAILNRKFQGRGEPWNPAHARGSPKRGFHTGRVASVVWASNLTGRPKNGPVRSWPGIKILTPRHPCENPLSAPGTSR